MTDTRHTAGEGLAAYPDPATWDDVEVYDAHAWPKPVTRRFQLVPTTCFNCEANCGLVAWIDKETGEIHKLEGNPHHPASRGRNCAKGPATLNQIHDPERILHPLRRRGPRGSGQWEQVSWDDALDDIGDRIRRAFSEGRHDEILYHVGRPGDDSYVERVLHAWGIDGHNSHTNICSSGARVGYAAWMGFDRPSADYANAKVIFLISSHLEAGHYFNPHAQRIIEGKQAGAKIICVDPRLSNTGSMADWWLPAWPGTEPVLLLAIARLLLEAGTWDREFVRRWVNWETYLAARHPARPCNFEELGPALLEDYTAYTPERAAQLCGIDADAIREIAALIGANLGRLATHNWRAAGAGNLGGWQTARCLFFLNVLTGSVGTIGGTSPNGWNKFIPVPPRHTDPQARWNELTWPIEYPLAHHEMSFLLPYFLKSGRGRVDTYFTRVYNPVWTNPDGFSWLEVLTDTDLVGCHVALTPTWSETAWFADYVLPMGLGAERHDVASYETHAGRWIGFRQPVQRRYADLNGHPVKRTHEANPGEVWEENEFWIDLSWRIDPDGDLGIRGHFESIERPGEPIGVDEYYQHLFTHSIPGLPEAAAERASRRWSTCAATVPSPSPATSTKCTSGSSPTTSSPVPSSTTTACTAYPEPLGATANWPRSKGTCRSSETARRRRRRRHSSRRVPDPVTQAGAVLTDAGRVGLAGVRHADLDPKPRPLGRPRPRRLRTDPHPHLPAPHADPHPLRQRQMAQRDQPPSPAVDPPARRRAVGHRGRRAHPDHDPHRVLRDRDVAHRGDPPRRGRLLPSHGPLAPRREQRERALVLGTRRPRPRRSWLGPAPAPRGAVVRQRRPRLVTHLVDRRRRAPEPDVRSTARPGVGHALLAAAGHRDARPSR